MDKMKKIVVVGLLALGALASKADVLTVAEPPQLDGKLTEAVWSKADWER